MSRTDDYIVATLLPYMQLAHDDPIDRVREFTVDQAAQLNVIGLPLLVNHSDGTRGTPLLEIGRVEALAVNRSCATVLASIASAASGEAAATSNLIAAGIYKDVSFSNDVSTAVRASDSRVVYEKTPLEVSVCEQGRRYGSRILAYCPSRATLERLAEHAPADLERLVDTHRYRDAVVGSPTTDRSRYIDALVAASDARLATAIAEHRLTMTTTIRASDSATTVTEPVPPVAASPVAAPPAAAPPVAAPPAAAPPVAAPPVSRTIETPASAVPSLQEAVDMSVKYKEEAVAASRALEEARAKAQAHEAEMVELRAFKAQRAEAEAKEVAKKKEKFEQIVRGFVQHAAAARTPKAEIDSTVESARDTFEKNPDASLAMMESSLRMAVRAADTTATTEKASAAKLAAMTQSLDNSYIESQMRRLQALNATDVSFSRAAQPPAAPRMVPLPPAAPAAAAPSATTTTTAATPAVGEKRAYVEKPTAQHFTVMASDDDFPATQIVQDFIQATGKVPSYKQVAHGEYYEATGRMQASADGQGEVPVMAKKRLRTTEARVTPWNYAPRWGAQLDRALSQVTGRPRFDTGKMVFRKTADGNQFA